MFDVNSELSSKIGELNKAIRERGEAKVALSRAQRLGAIGHLTGGVAHDFNNLLAIILGNLELLQDEGDPEDHDRQIETAIEATTRGADLTKQYVGLCASGKTSSKGVRPD